MRQAQSQIFLTKMLIMVGLLGAQIMPAQAQVGPPPERIRLLNDLQVLLAPRPGAPDVLVKLRIHSGAAFDLEGKAGTMALLGDLLFPDPNTREYFTEEMQGRLSVSTDYDSVTITMQGRAREFERIIEILRNALVSTQLTAENVSKIREGRTKIIRDTSLLPAAVADRAIASRLFGDFPYGRPSNGSVESLARVERADVMLARERFLNPNNSTLVIVGDVQPSRARRALRQLLGIWRKSEAIVPGTFKQPTLPDPRTLMVNTAADQSVEVRLAVRGVSREDPDAAAANLLAIVARERWEKLLPDLSRGPVFVRSDAFALPGMFVMGATIDNLLAGKALTTGREALRSLASTPVTASELQDAKNEAIAFASKDLTKPDGMADVWLDVDRYKLPAEMDPVRALNALTAEDLRKAAARLVDERGIAAVVVGKALLVKPLIEQQGKVEVVGEVESKPEARPDPKANAIKPIPKPASRPK